MVPAIPTPLALTVTEVVQVTPVFDARTSNVPAPTSTNRYSPVTACDVVDATRVPPEKSSTSQLVPIVGGGQRTIPTIPFTTLEVATLLLLVVEASAVAVVAFAVSVIEPLVVGAVADSVICIDCTPVRLNAPPHPKVVPPTPTSHGAPLLATAEVIAAPAGLDASVPETPTFAAVTTLTFATVTV